MNYKDFMARPGRDCAIIAHRGIWRDAPENSLQAIEAAIAGGYDVVEIDVRRSADGALFLCHDDSLERMTGHDAAVEELAASELAALHLRNRDGGAGNALTDQKLARLSDVFDLTRDRIFIHLDVKDRLLIPEVIAAAQAAGVDQQVDFWSALRDEDDFAWINSNIMAHGVPFIAKTRLNVPGAELQTELVFRIKPLICEIYFDSIEQLAAHRDRFAAAGISLWVNTLDDVSCAGLTDSAALEDPDAVWGRLLDAGVSAIQTDEAAALKAYLATRR
ncbi:glycerophosphodiester phosphodiesterase [Devosia sp. Leaf420]|uniref:glycerophosphodiester phosphodiesterase family protein n=1 Tax=Devosia sp. Leaf420 TaxID=1736374 RepID=UPI0007127EBA|nr:glycerophosphodiester phosphodiesterase family protein [Devosia sp. Leaf420]KQT51512.1 glycerophosphodiester phosphodiesterase [Devosia sp. Leaf420]